VIAICESMFKLPPNDERLTVLEMDALDFVNDPANLERLRRAAVRPVRRHRQGPGARHARVLPKSCNACLAPGGIMTVNLFGDHPSSRATSRR
jgi:spermidine synthase